MGCEAAGPVPSPSPTLLLDRDLGVRTLLMLMLMMSWDRNVSLTQRSSLVFSDKST